MLHKGIRFPSGAKARSCATPRPATPRGSAVAPASTAAPTSRASRTTIVTSAVAYETAPAQDDALSQSPRISALRLSAEADTTPETPMVTARFIVPHFVTKPGQQLFLSGSTSELGEWDAHLGIPLEWREGHQHVATVRLPVSRVVQVKLLLKENGRPVLTEEGDPRDVMLMPVSDSSDAAAAKQHQQPQHVLGLGAEAQEEVEGATVLAPASVQRPAAAGPRLDYQVTCHFGCPEATQILRLPVVLPPKESGDRRVLCKFVVMLDHLKLEPRQYAVVVGNVEELGGWKSEGGLKLMRQVGGYWTRRVELPLLDGPIQAKVVICNADGKAAVWEPGTANRVLAPPQRLPPDVSSAADAMHIFVCRWSSPEQTSVVSVPVEYERADKEFLKQLDVAQREIGIMRRAVTAKSRQCQSLESELAASRRAERALREEVAGLRSEVGYLMQELEFSQRGELSARQEAAELHERLQELGQGYERQIQFLEAKLDEMEAELVNLHQRLATPAVNGHHHQQQSSSSHYSSVEPQQQQEIPRVISRSNWR